MTQAQKFRLRERCPIPSSGLMTMRRAVDGSARYRDTNIKRYIPRCVCHFSVTSLDLFSFFFFVCGNITDFLNLLGPMICLHC